MAVNRTLTFQPAKVSLSRAATSPARVQPTRRTTRPAPPPPSRGHDVRDVLSNIRSGSSGSGSQLQPRAASSGGGKAPSTLGQMRQLVTGLPHGLVSFGADMFIDTLALPHIALDAAKDQHLRGWDAYIPAISGLVKSGNSTVQDIAHPERFAQASEEGTIVAKIVEDIGNVAIAGSAAARGLGAGARVAPMTVEEAGALRGAYQTAEQAAARTAVESAALPAAEGGSALTDAAKFGGRHVSEWTLPRRGLSRVAAKAGSEGLADTLNRAGNVVRDVSHFGERAGNVPALPYQLAGRGINAVAARAGLEGGISGGLARAAGKVAPRVAGHFAFRASEEGQFLNQTVAQAEQAGTRATRFSLGAADEFAQSGLNEAEGRAVGTSIDLPNLGRDLSPALLTDDVKLQEFLDRSYERVEESERPTVEHMRTHVEYMRHLEDPKYVATPELAAKFAKMDAVREQMLTVAKDRTERAVVSGLHPEQRAPELRGTKVTEYQQGLERPRNLMQRRWEQAENTAVRTERVAAAHEAIYDAKVPPPAGVPADIAAQVEAKTTEIVKATDEYVRLVDEGRVEAVAAGVKLDALLDEARTIKEQAGWVRSPGSVKTNVVGADGKLIREATSPPSPHERAMGRQAVARDRANMARAKATRLKKSVDTYNEKIGEARSELSRTFQNRLHQDVNVPAVTQMRNAIATGGTKLGTLIGDGDALSINGTIGHLGDKYGFTGELIEALDDARAGRFDELMDEVPDEYEHLPDLTPEEVGMITNEIIRELGIKLEPHDAQRLVDSIGRDTLLDDMAARFEGEDLSGRRLNSPHRVADVVNAHTWNMPAEARNRFDAAYERYQTRRAKILRQTYNTYTAAIPARFRSAAQAGQRQIGALLDMAEEHNRKRPHDGDVYIDMAEQTMSTLDQMVKAGFDPEHLIGGRPASTSSAATNARGAGLTQTKQRGERTRRSGLRQLSQEAYARVEAHEAGVWVKNQRNAAIEQKIGTQARDLPEVTEALADWAEAHNGEIMPPETLGKITAEAGWVAIDSAKRINPQTMLVPKQVADHLKGGDFNIPGFGVLRRANQVFKTWVLPFSPKWQVGNVLGNVIQASVHGGISPVELVTTMRRIAKYEGGVRELWRQSGLPEWTRAEVANHGLTIDEYRLARGLEDAPPKTIVGKTARFSYRINEFVDNLTRSAVDLAALGKGQSSDQALQTTIRSLGDYSRMSNFERKVIREVVPFYAWLRHSTIATLRLPIQSPARAAFLLHLSDVYSDPEMSAELLTLIGSKVPIAGGLLNLGTVSPLTNVLELNPVDLGSNISPAIKATAGIVAGWDLNKMKPISRPESTANLDEFGRPETTPPITRLFTDPMQGLGEIGWQLTQNAPTQIRVARDLALGDEARYGGTGYQYQNKTDPNKRLSLRQVLKMLNLPSIDTVPELRSD